VGLTGGLGAGKSEALRALGELGAATLSTDDVVRDLLATNELRELVVARLGPEVARDGALDRSAIAQRVFGDDEARQWLETELWPRVGERVAAWRQDVDAADPPPRAAVVEVPLLFESGMEAVFDRTIAVVADEDVREERAAARGHASVAERAARQLPQAEKAVRADYTVRNDGSLKELKKSLFLVLGKLEGS
jgi:dephospho-CoA kinase